MNITIAPFTVDTIGDCKAPLSVYKKEEHAKMPTTYWGIYLDDKYISYTSSKELAEKTKLWIERWLENRR
ncbi:MAG: hypothetical protein C4291_12920 [Candidatus Dadabacteria bacterium]